MTIWFRQWNLNSWFTLRFLHCRRLNRASHFHELFWFVFKICVLLHRSTGNGRRPNILWNRRGRLNDRRVLRFRFLAPNRLLESIFFLRNICLALSFNNLNAFKFWIINLYFPYVCLLYHAWVALAPLFLLIGFLPQYFFHMMYFWFLKLIIDIPTVMNKLIALAINFGDHLILLIYASVPTAIAVVLLRLVVWFNAVVWPCVAAMRLTACGQQIVRVVHVQNLILISSASSFRCCSASTSVFSVSIKNV